MFKTPPALLSRFYQLESSLASHSVTTFQIKKSKKMLQETYLGGYNLPWRNCNMPWDKFFTLNFKKSFFSKHETEEKQPPNNFKILRNTFQFSVQQLIPNYSPLKYTHTSLKPIQDGLFWGCLRTMGYKKALLPKICHTFLTMMKLSRVTPYLKKIQKVYQSRGTPL